MAARRNLSVRQVEQLVKRGDRPTVQQSTDAKPKPKHLADVEASLTRALGLPVTLRPGRRKNAGSVVIRYASLAQFDRIAELIGGRATLEEP